MEPAPPTPEVPMVEEPAVATDEPELTFMRPFRGPKVGALQMTPFADCVVSAQASWGQTGFFAGAFLEFSP